MQTLLTEEQLDQIKDCISRGLGSILTAREMGLPLSSIKRSYARMRHYVPGDEIIVEKLFGLSQNEDLPLRLETIKQARRIRKEDLDNTREINSKLDWANFVEECAASFKEAHPPLVYKTMKDLTNPKASHSRSEAVDFLALWSDWHYAAVIKPNQVQFLNEFNSEIALEYVKDLVEKNISVIRHEQGSHPCTSGTLWLGGDFFEGMFNFPSQILQIDKHVIAQIRDIAPIIAQAIISLLSVVKKIHVLAQRGNHARLAPKGVFPEEVSLDYLLYDLVKAHLSNYPQITMDIIEEEVYRYDIRGHQFSFQHGESLGNPKTLRGIDEATTIEMAITSYSGKKTEYMVCGHFHRYYTADIMGGGELIINGCFPGISEYGLKVGKGVISRPTQFIGFVHAKRALAARYPLRLERSNNDR
jgi:hypothetical protein